MGAKPNMKRQLKRAILQAGISRRQLALRAKVPEATLCMFLSGKRSMTFDSFVKLAAVLGLELRPRKQARKGRKGG